MSWSTDPSIGRTHLKGEIVASLPSTAVINPRKAYDSEQAAATQW